MSRPARPPQDSGIARFTAWARIRENRLFRDYDELWRWSVEDISHFWEALWEYYGIRTHARYEQALSEATMPGACWFPGARLNYTEHILGGVGSGDGPAEDDIAIVGRSQTIGDSTLTYGQLRDAVARARAGLQRLGIGPGDRVAAYLPNIPEAVVAFLATASLGAIWSSCAPEFGPRSVVNRFVQLDPTVLLVVGGYQYGEKEVDRRPEVAALRSELPTVRHVVQIPYGPHTLPDTMGWDELLAEHQPLEFTPVAFDHPLWVVFSSGTTGRPKAIVHGHGGILLEQLKTHDLVFDTRPGDRMLWFTTTAWIMWNTLVSGLLRRASIVLFDGNPLWPDIGAQWALAAEAGATLLGTSPTYLMNCRKDGLRPEGHYDLSTLRQVGVTGSPLPGEGASWVVERLGEQVLVNSISGGTDICGGFVAGNPWLPMVPGAIAGRCLGVDVTTFDPAGHEVAGELGELVVRQPMPSMPVSFWNDQGHKKFRDAYFDTYPGIWRHGDWARFRTDGSCEIAGRSDATLNRGGVRLGTSEFYEVVEALPEVIDSLLIHLEDIDGGAGQLMLFLVLAPSWNLDDTLLARIRRELKTQLSPRHIPDTIRAVPTIPRTISGKKIETAVKKILQGTDPAAVVDPGTLADPAALDAIRAAHSASGNGPRTAP
ncbi:acetoacetate--CoA ligase [Streptomyces sp. NPDC052036]|uniref:acetoacetate--CoA ligase n=1 Tax=unclassified Streptomyces TaxID=2593676 RepID=UPI003421FFE6